MKKIHVIATSDRRLLILSCPSDLPRVLKKNEQWEKEWIYKPPTGLQEFLHEYPETLQGFLEAFSYWVEFRAKGHIENTKRYEAFEKKVKKFSEDLLTRIRGLASRIAKQVAKIWRPKYHYDEYREKKLNAIQPGLGKKRLTGKEKQTIIELQGLRSQYEKSHQSKQYNW